MDRSLHRAEVSPLALTAAGLAMIAVTFGMARYGYGLFLPAIERDFGLGVEILGFMASGSYAGYLAATVIASVLSGRVGPRIPLVAGGLAATLGTIGVALAPTPWMLACAIVLAGSSPGFVFPPISDAVSLLVAPRLRDRVFTVINAGTGIGVVVAGPLALASGTDWRQAWLVFALCGLGATIWNGLLVPPVRQASAGGPGLPGMSLRWLFKPPAHRLFLASALAGLVTAVYWTFTVRLIVEAGGTLPFAFAAGQEGLRVGFWVVLGLSGSVGALAGDCVGRFGLRCSYVATMIGIAAALLLAALAPGQWPALVPSAVLFGGMFIMITGILGVWSMRVFHDRPSAGFGMTFFFFTAGAMAGPALVGLGAAATGLAAMFVAAACLSAAGVLLAPPANGRG